MAGAVKHKNPPVKDTIILTNIIKITANIMPLNTPITPPNTELTLPINLKENNLLISFANIFVTKDKIINKIKVKTPLINGNAIGFTILLQIHLLKDRFFL